MIRKFTKMVVLGSLVFTICTCRPSGNLIKFTTLAGGHQIGIEETHLDFITPIKPEKQSNSLCVEISELLLNAKGLEQTFTDGTVLSIKGALIDTEGNRYDFDSKTKEQFRNGFCIDPYYDKYNWLDISKTNKVFVSAKIAINRPVSATTFVWREYNQWDLGDNGP